MLIVALVVAFVLAVSLREIAGVYTDYLWFESLDLVSVWRTIAGTQIALIGFFTGLAFLLVWANLAVADRLSARTVVAAPTGDDEIVVRYRELVGNRARIVRAGVAGLVALIAGGGAATQWQSWVLFRHRQDFGIDDATFGVDVGFYVFQLPFLRFLTGWLFSTLLVVLLVTALVHYLNGGIRTQTPGDRVASPVKAHLSLLLAALALVRAGQYLLDRYDLVYSSRGPVDGATYTDVNVQLRAIHLLVLISLFATGLFIANIWRRGWVLPVMAVGLWVLVALLAGEAIPAFVQRFRVEPEKAALEEPYVDNNITATRTALGLDDVTTEEFAASRDLEGEELVDDPTISNIRLWDTDRLQRSFENERDLPAYYAVPDVDFDRYEVDGQVRQLAIAPRQLDDRSIPEDQSGTTSNWENERLVYTSGNDVLVAPANAKTGSDEPDVIDDGDRGSTTYPTVDDASGARSLYFGEDLSGYKIVKSEREELREGEEYHTYEGIDGVPLDSAVRRAAFALRFGEIEPLISGSIRPDSRVLMRRDVVERAEAVAPFLAYDHDPYAVVLGDRVVYVLDGYTTSDRFPNAERVPTDDLPGDSGLAGRSFNYVRNSVKVVIDAYDGTVTLYVTDDEDPLIRAYQEAFPDLFEPVAEADDALRDHIRHPEDLFRVQTTMWARYHVSDPRSFLEGNGRWTVAPAPETTSTAGSTSATGSTTSTPSPAPARQQGVEPTYQLIDLPGGEEGLSFELVRPFTPPSRGQLSAFMTARPDGTLVTWRIPSDLSVNGPRAIAGLMDQTDEAGELRRLFDDERTTLSFGNVLLVPVGDSIIYVRSVYVTRDGRPNIKAVMVAYQRTDDDTERAVQPTLALALEDLFGVDGIATLEEGTDQAGEFDDAGGDATDEPAAEEETPSTTDPEEEPSSTFEGDDDELVAAIAAAFDDADEALRRGDLPAWTEAIEEAESLSRILAARREAATGDPPPTTAGTTAPGTTLPGA